MRLQDKVTIITGAGSGMGRVAAEMFAAEGARVVVAEFSEAAGEETAAVVRAAGGEATFIKVDVSKEADAKAMVDHAVATYGRARLPVQQRRDHARGGSLGHRHGRGDVGRGHGCQRPRRVPRLQVRHAGDGRAGVGSIINIASFVAILGCSVPQDAYTASKGAVLALTRSMAVQFAGTGVRSNAISPGPVETPLLMDWLLKDEAAKQLRLDRNPTGRFGKPEEIVNMAVYLASDESTLDERRKLRHRRRHQRQLLLAARPGPQGPAMTPAAVTSRPPSRGALPVPDETSHPDDATTAIADEAAALAEAHVEDDQDKAPAAVGEPVDPGTRRVGIGVDVGGSGIKAAAVDLDTG